MDFIFTERELNLQTYMCESLADVNVWQGCGPFRRWTLGRGESGLGVWGFLFSLSLSPLSSPPPWLQWPAPVPCVYLLRAFCCVIPAWCAPRGPSGTVKQTSVLSPCVCVRTPSRSRARREHSAHIPAPWAAALDSAAPVISPGQCLPLPWLSLYQVCRFTRGTIFTFHFSFLCVYCLWCR